MTTPTTTPAETPTHSPRRRADAERNRARILDAARTLITQHGTHISMHDIARHAQVGIGTLYRHFPTKAAMLETAAQQRFAEILTYYHSINHHDTNALDALHLLLTRIAETEIDNRPYTHTLHPELQDQLTTLVTQGQHTGTIRRDIQPADILPLAHALTCLTHHTPNWQHCLTITLDGLRPQHAVRGE